MIEAFTTHKNWSHAMMIGVYATLQVKPESQTECIELIKQFIAESRTHKGCISYDCGEVHDVPNAYCFIERWESQADLDAHLQSDFFVQNAPKLMAMTENGIAIHTLKLMA